MKECRECRWYDGIASKCKRTKGGKNPTSTCSFFGSRVKSITTYCKDCELYDSFSSKCKRTKGGRNPTSTCSFFVPYR